VSDLAFKPGDQVETPAHGVGTIVGYNNGIPRGRQWRETSWNVQVPGLGYAVWYYESELRRV
jgi:hypothetical protein